MIVLEERSSLVVALVESSSEVANKRFGGPFGGSRFGGTIVASESKDVDVEALDLVLAFSGVTTICRRKGWMDSGGVPPASQSAIIVFDVFLRS